MQTRGASAALTSGTSDAVTVTTRSWFNEGAGILAPLHLYPPVGLTTIATLLWAS